MLPAVFYICYLGFIRTPVIKEEGKHIYTQAAINLMHRAPSTEIKNTPSEAIESSPIFNLIVTAFLYILRADLCKSELK